MAYPAVVPFNTAQLPVSFTSISATTGQIAAPFAGRITLCGVTTGATGTSTADSTCTISVNGTAVPNAVVTTVVGTAPYTATTIGLSSGGIVNLGDTISFAFTGATGGGGTPTAYVQVRRGTI
jgi:hypothetical protein